MLGRRIVAAPVAALAVAVLIPMAIAFACTPLAKITLSASNGSAGDSITVNGYYFAGVPNETAAAWAVVRWEGSSGPILWQGAPVAPATPSDPNFSFTFTVPSVGPGDYYVSAYPEDQNHNPMTNPSNGTTIHYNAQFTVNAPPSPPTPAPVASGPAAAAPVPAQASGSAGSTAGSSSSQAPPPSVEAPAAQAPAAAGSGASGAGSGQSDGNQHGAPTSQQPAARSAPARPGAGSGIAIPVLTVAVLLVVATAGLVLLLIRRRGGSEPPAEETPSQPAALPPAHTSYATLPARRQRRPDAGAYVRDPADEEGREPVGAAPTGRRSDE